MVPVGMLYVALRGYSLQVARTGQDERSGYDRASCHLEVSQIN